MGKEIFSIAGVELFDGFAESDGVGFGEAIIASEPAGETWQSRGSKVETSLNVLQRVLP